MTARKWRWLWKEPIIKEHSALWEGYYICTLCGAVERFAEDHPAPYCWNCGKQMFVEDDGDDA